MLAQAHTRTLIDELLAEQQRLTAVELFSLRHARNDFQIPSGFYRALLPVPILQPGEQFAFQVDLDACSGCKACVTACHNRNGLEEGESWREVGLLHGTKAGEPFLQTITTACHHCLEPACLEGCPVLAYDKDPLTGIVRHLDDQCIGCQYCVMKCPYEVPKYSERLGIVRKCDLCANRLATGEAPACAQACPSAAIQISVVAPEEVRARFTQDASAFGSSSGENVTENSFLPDSPDPRITLPTTRFVSRRGLPADAVAGDHGVLRLEKAHWPLIVLLVLTQAAAGVSLAGALLRTAGVNGPAWICSLMAFALTATGLATSVLHLGQPLKAWRAFLGWRTSWLSREIVAFNALTFATGLAVIAPWVGSLAAQQFILAWAVAGCAILAVGASAMVYIDTGRRPWSPGIVFGNFVGTTFVLGASTSAVLCGVRGDNPFAWVLVWAALLLRTALFVWRRQAFARAGRDPGCRLHFAAQIVGQLIPWTSRVETILFAATVMVTGLALTGYGPLPALWAGLAAMLTFASEIVARYIFFAAGASKRMPGGIAP